MRKTLAIVGVVLLVLVGGYAAAGYWWAPGYLRDTLVEQASKRGLDLRLDTVRIDPFQLQLQIDGIELRGKGRDSAFATVRGASADLTWASLWKRTVIIDQARVDQPRLDVEAVPPIPTSDSPSAGGGVPPLLLRELVVDDGTVRLEQQDLSVEALRFELSDLSTRAGDAGRFRGNARVAGGTVSTQGDVALSPDGLALRNVVAEGRGVSYAGVSVRELKLQAAQLAVPPKQPIEFDAQASLEPQGKVSAQGSLAPQPLRADLQIEVDALALPQAQRWLPPNLAMKIAAGTLSGRGQLQFASGGSPLLSYKGGLSVRDLRLDERDGGQLLLGWSSAATNDLALDVSPTRIRLTEVVLQAPQGRLVIEKGGRTNVAQVFGAAPSSPGSAASPDGGAASAKAASAPGAGTAPQAAASAPGDGPSPGRSAESRGDDGAALQFSLDRLRVEQGVLYFADRSLDETPFEVKVEDLVGSVAGISTPQGDPAQVDFAGRVASDGQVKIEGTLDIDSPKTLADIRADFRNLPLPTFNPYVAKFAGYRIESGRLSAQLHYEVRDGRLQADNEFVFRQLKLGEKLEKRGVIDLPLELAVALLSDSQGRIDLAIPVSGDLNDPKIDVSALIANAIGSVIRNIVSAPFQAIAGLFGGGEGGAGGGASGDPGELRFDAGGSTLSGPAERQVARVSKALRDRPQLDVVVRGGYDADRDRDMLRQRAARRQIAQRAGVAADAALDFSDPRVLGAAQQLVAERAGGAPEAPPPGTDAAARGQALVERLAAAEAPDAQALPSLARDRAESMRSALLAQGVDASRVRIQDPASRVADQGRVPNTLSLSVRGSDAAPLTPARAAPARTAGGSGATAAGPGADSGAGGPRDAATVRRLQRGLNDAGFDAGPVDGRWGPKTRAALRAFQYARELPITGRPDVPTLAALKDGRR